MQFPCARCGRTYEIADELCLGRAVKVACPACGNLAVHRVPAKGGPSAAEAAPAPPPAPEMASALGDVSDEDFESAWSSVEAPPWSPGAPAPAAPPAPIGPPPPEAPPVSAAARGAGSARGAAPAKVSGAAAGPRATAPVAAGAGAAPARRPPPVPEEEPVMVTAELVLRRSTRRARLGAAAAAVAVLAALGGGGWLALRWKRDPAAAAARAARPGEVAGAGEAGAAGGLSAADLAKLMGRREPEPAPVAPRVPAPAQAQAKPTARTLEDKALLDLLARKQDAAVTVGADEVEALSTSRGTLDEAAIEGTLSRNSGSITACVNRAIAASPDQRLPATRVNLELTIRPSGRVERAAVQEAAIARLPLGQCIAQAAKRMVFPGFDGAAIDLVVPLKLKVGL